MKSAVAVDLVNGRRLGIRVAPLTGGRKFDTGWGHAGTSPEGRRMRSVATRRVKAEHGTAPAVWTAPKSAAELVDSLIEEALTWGASDVHLEPNEEGMQVRFRVHGLLQNVMTVAPRERAAVVSRIKIMANLDIAEHRLPQDGRIRIRQNGH
ncbi:MAG: Flp pilus assembly complex ATPase component TadA, partial [Candidatus Rokubacteria bacterium]|nr:Flp pilus assembly complex ATPase component TadA [Candidatus Rokubacteria bacterium]